MCGDCSGRQLRGLHPPQQGRGGRRCCCRSPFFACPRRRLGGEAAILRCNRQPPESIYCHRGRAGRGTERTGAAPHSLNRRAAACAAPGLAARQDAMPCLRPGKRCSTLEHFHSQCAPHAKTTRRQCDELDGTGRPDSVTRFVATELVAGLTTFLTMAYIIFVHPWSWGCRDTGGRLRDHLYLIAALGTTIMALYANYPIALAPGMKPERCYQR
ncbi:Coatomer subunit epsilon [Manis javanica]|nr:Coatomer subunit epsilon [Manis javanica]